MNINTSRLNFIPLTHILLACAISSIGTATSLFFQQAQLIILAYVMLAAVCLITKKYTHIFILAACALCSVQIYFKINKIQKNYSYHQKFLKIPTIVTGKILQKQTMQADKDQTTLLLKTSTIYNKLAGKLTQSVKILLVMPAKRASEFIEGQTITVFQAKLQQPSIDSNYTNYLLKEEIWATTFITNQHIKIKNRNDRTWLAKCSALFSSCLNRSTINLFNPLFLGKREKTLDSIEMQHQSVYAGIAHHMARSGIHLVTLFGLFMLFFHYVRIKFMYRYIICALLMLGYCQISVASLSFLRALCMIAIQIFSKLNKAQYSSVHALTLTTLFFVMNNPYCILFLDFQLSFGMTAVIIWLFQAKSAKIVAFQPKSLIPS